MIKYVKWKIPPKIKIYEALGTIGDGRVEVSGDTAKVFSSSGNKFYSVDYDPDTNSITSNDNGSYWVGYLGYPSIAFLLFKEIIGYRAESAEALKGIQWKDVNTKFKNDFNKTEVYVKDVLNKKGIDSGALAEEVEGIFERLKKLNPDKLGKTAKPPVGY